jgi:hypothetical protein
MAFLEEIVQADDVDDLQSLIAHGISIGFTLEAVSDSQPDLLRASSPLVFFSAFHRAENCIQYLLLNGADIHGVDSLRRTIVISLLPARYRRSSLI